MHLPSLYTVAALDGETAPYIMGTILNLLGGGNGKDSGSGGGEAQAGGAGGAGVGGGGKAPEGVMCIGHNKGWEEAASLFCGEVVKLESASAALLSRPDEDSWEGAFDDEGQWHLDGIVTG